MPYRAIGYLGVLRNLKILGEKFCGSDKAKLCNKKIIWQKNAFCSVLYVQLGFAILTFLLIFLPPFPSFSPRFPAPPLIFSVKNYFFTLFGGQCRIIRACVVFLLLLATKGVASIFIFLDIFWAFFRLFQAFFRLRGLFFRASMMGWRKNCQFFHFSTCIKRLLIAKESKLFVAVLINVL